MKNIRSTVLNSTTFSLAMNGIPIILIVSLFKILSINHRCDSIINSSLFLYLSLGIPYHLKTEAVNCSSIPHSLFQQLTQLIQSFSNNKSYVYLSVYLSLLISISLSFYIYNISIPFSYINLLHPLHEDDDPSKTTASTPTYLDKLLSSITFNSRTTEQEYSRLLRFIRQSVVSLLHSPSPHEEPDR